MLQKKLSESSKADERKKALKAEFEAEKQNKVEEARTRIVNFKVAVGCGCGGEYRWYHGEVPVDSYIQDGDHFYDIPDEAFNVERGKI